MSENAVSLAMLIGIPIVLSGLWLAYSLVMGLYDLYVNRKSGTLVGAGCAIWVIAGALGAVTLFIMASIAVGSVFIT